MDFNSSNFKLVLSSFAAVPIRKSTTPHSPTSSILSLNRDAFLKRLKSFSPFNWFAKPDWLAPSLCARYGWENCSKDTLRCFTCKAYLSCRLPTTMEPGVYEECCARIKDGLRSSHYSSCIWTANPCPEEFVQAAVITKNEVIEQVSDFLQNKNVLPRLPDDILKRLDINEAVIDCVMKAARPETNTVAEIVSSLALISCGWCVTKEQSHLVVQCEFCQRKLGLWNFYSLFEKENVEATDSEDMCIIPSKRNKSSENSSHAPTRDTNTDLAFQIPSHVYKSSDIIPDESGNSQPEQQSDLSETDNFLFLLSHESKEVHDEGVGSGALGHPSPIRDGDKTLENNVLQKFGDNSDSFKTDIGTQDGNKEEQKIDKNNEAIEGTGRDPEKQHHEPKHTSQAFMLVDDQTESFLSSEKSKHQEESFEIDVGTRDLTVGRLENRYNNETMEKSPVEADPVEQEQSSEGFLLFDGRAERLASETVADTAAQEEIMENSSAEQDNMENSPAEQDNMEKSPPEQDNMEKSPAEQDNMENSPAKQHRNMENIHAEQHMENIPAEQDNMENSPAEQQGNMENIPAEQHMENSPAEQDNMENSPAEQQRNMENIPAEQHMENSPAEQHNKELDNETNSVCLQGEAFSEEERSYLQDSPSDDALNNETASVQGKHDTEDSVLQSQQAANLSESNEGPVISTLQGKRLWKRKKTLLDPLREHYTWCAWVHGTPCGWQKQVQVLKDVPTTESPRQDIKEGRAATAAMKIKYLFNEWTSTKVKT